LMLEDGIQVGKEDVMEQAVKVAQYRFATYGLYTVPEEQLEKYAGSLLANEKEARKIVEMVENDKVTDLIRSKVTLDTDEVPFSKMREMNTNT